MKINFLFILILIGCSIKHSEYDVNSKQTNLDSLSTGLKQTSFDTIFSLPEQAIEIDSLLFDSVKINDNLPLKLKETDLLNKLGQPDSIVVEHGWDCGNYLDDLDSVKVYYYGLSRYIISKGKALLHVFSPDKKLSFGTNNFKITGETSELEIKVLFPKSYTNMAYWIERKKHSGKRELKVGMITNPMSTESNGFIFYFENGRLIRIELWWFIC